MSNRDIKDQGNPFEAFAQSNGDNLKKFSDELLEKFRGKVLEIYIGDQSETLTFEEYSVPQNCIIYGKLIDVLDRMLILNCYYVDKVSKEVKDDNICYISLFQVRAMTELNEQGTLNDIFLDSRSSEKVRRAILSLEKKF